MSKFNFLKKLGLLGAITAAISGCGFNPEQNIEVDVYGPPVESFDEYDDPVAVDDMEDTEDIDSDFTLSGNWCSFMASNQY